VKILSTLIQLGLGKYPPFIALSSILTAECSVGTEVTAKPMKSPFLSGEVTTRTGRLFRVLSLE